MGYIIKKMNNQVPEGFFGFNVFLATDLAITTGYFSSAVKTIFFLSFFKMRHLKSFNKNNTFVIYEFSINVFYN